MGGYRSKPFVIDSKGFFARSMLLGMQSITEFERTELTNGHSGFRMKCSRTLSEEKGFSIQALASNPMVVARDCSFRSRARTPHLRIGFPSSGELLCHKADH
jgi:hypothetical protein